MLNEGQVSEKTDSFESIKLQIRKNENLIHELCLLHPFLHVYFCNSKGENILNKSVKVHRTSNERYGSCNFPIRIDFDETVWIEGPMLHSIVDDDVVILIEVVEATTDIKRSLYDVKAKVMGYAFLKLMKDMNEVASDVEECRGTQLPNISCKLQTFEWQRMPWFRKSHPAGLAIDVRKVPKVFTQFLLKRKSMLSSHLYIEIEASEIVVDHSITEMDKDIQFNHDGITDNTIQSDIHSNNEFEKKEDESILASYKRPFNGKCQLPDELFMKIDVCNVVTSSLSNSGDVSQL